MDHPLLAGGGLHFPPASSFWKLLDEIQLHRTMIFFLIELTGGWQKVLAKTIYLMEYKPLYLYIRNSNPNYSDLALYFIV